MQNGADHLRGSAVAAASCSKSPRRLGMRSSMELARAAVPRHGYELHAGGACDVLGRDVRSEFGIDLGTAECMC